MKGEIVLYAHELKKQFPVAIVQGYCQKIVLMLWSGFSIIAELDLDATTRAARARPDLLVRTELLQLVYFQLVAFRLSYLVGCEALVGKVIFRCIC